MVVDVEAKATHRIMIAIDIPATDETPLHFVRSGLVGDNRGSIRYVGANGVIWSTAASFSFTSEEPELAGYYLSFGGDDTVLISHGPFARYYAFPIRCLTY